jgi:hypothetical protein
MPMSPTLVAAVFAFVCVGGFLLGLRFYRMSEPPSGTTVEQARRFGRLLMMASTGLLLFLVAVILHGDFRVLPAARVIR